MDTMTEETPQLPPVEAAPTETPKAPKGRRKVVEAEATSAGKPGATLDDVMELLDKQDEALKVLTGQAKEMLATNAAVRRAVRQAVKDASRHDELAAELDRFKKRWANLKSIVS